MMEVDEGTLAAQVRALQPIDTTHVWARVRASLKTESTARRRPAWFVIGRQHRLLIAVIAAIALTLVGSAGIAVTMMNRPAVVHGIPITGGPPGGVPGHMAYPGHPVKTTVDEAGRLAGFRILTLARVQNATLRSVTYVPPVVLDGHPGPERGGAVTLDYLVDGTDVEIIEALDPNPSAPLDYNQKVPPGSSAALCSKVETIGGNEYVVVRCPEGTAINSVYWKTLDGVDIKLGPMPPSAGGAPGDTPSLPMQVVLTVINNLR